MTRRFNTVDRCYIDELSEDDPKPRIYCSKFTNYVKTTYNLSIQEYYNLVVFNDKDYVVKCKRCGNPTKFKGFRLGYNEYCSRSCITKDTLETMNESGTNPFTRESFIEENRKRVSEFQKNRIKDGTHQFLNYTREQKEIISYKRFLTYGYSKARLYICEATDDPNLLKLGITGIYKYNSRQGYEDHYLRNHKYILEGDPEKIAKIELDIKRDHLGRNEFFDRDNIDNVIKWLNEYSIKYKL